MKNLSEVYLITEELLKLYSNVTRNVGVNKVYPYIGLAQAFYLTPILGKPLLEELQIQVSEGTISDPNKALLLKIAPALALWTEYLGLRGLAYSITEKGITKEHSDNSESIDAKEIAEWKEETKTYAELATQQLKDFLCDCQENYPLFPKDSCKCHNTPRQSQIYFPKREKSCGCGCK